MKFKPFIATALMGLLSSSVVANAKTEHILNPDRWNGGAVGLGNLRGGGSGKFTLNTNADQNIFFRIIESNNNWATGLLFDHSSYRSLDLPSTTMEFGTIFSSLHVATGIRTISNPLTLSLRDASDSDITFLSSVKGNKQASGFWFEDSSFTLKTGTIKFDTTITATNGIASGFYFVGQSSASSIELMGAYQESAKIKINTISGREAYGFKYETNHNGNLLTIDSASYLNHNERGGIYISSINSTSGNAGLILSNGNANITLSNFAVLNAGNIQSNSQGFGAMVRDGNLTLTLKNYSEFSINSLVANDETYGFYNVGNDYVGAKTTIQAHGASNIIINNISSTSNSAYGVYSSKETVLDTYGDNSAITFGTISSSNNAYAYGITSGNYAKLKAVNGGHITFESIQGGLGAYGINSLYNTTIDTTGNTRVNFGSIVAQNSRGNAVGIQSNTFFNYIGSIGSQITFDSIRAGSEANGIRVRQGATIDFSDDPYQSGKGSGITFRSIEANGHNAIGIYAPDIGLFSFLGGGRTTFDSINYSGNRGNSIYTSAGIVVDSGRTVLEVSGGHELSFNSITSANDAFGMRLNAIEMNINGTGSLLKFGTIDGVNGATGIQTNGEFKTWVTNGAITLNKITTQNNGAYGLRLKGDGFVWLTNSRMQISNVSSQNGSASAIWENSGSLIFTSNSTFNSQSIVGRTEAEGFKINTDLQFKVDNRSSVTFANINATGGNAYGIKAGSRATVWARDNGTITFGNITGSGNSAGIFASNINITTEQESYLKFTTVYSANGRSSGLEGDTIIFTGINNGQVRFENISSGIGVNGIRVGQQLDVNLTNGTIADALLFQNLVSQNGNALGIYAPNGATITFRGSGSNAAFKNIEHQGISSSNFASGIISDGKKISVNVTSGNHLWFDSISSNGGNAYGIKVNSLILNVDASSSIHFLNLSAQNRSIGIWLSDGNSATIQGGGKIEFRKIQSNSDDRVGIRAWNSNLTINNTSLVFGTQTGSNKYGIYSNIDSLKHTFGDISINVQGQNSVAIYGASSTTIELQGGKTMTLSAKNSNGKEAMAIDGSVNLAMKGNNANLVIDAGNGKIQRLDVTNGSNINLIGTTQRSADNLQLRRLTVESWNGSGANVLLYANATSNIDTTSFDGRAYRPDRNRALVGGSDRLIINNTTLSGRQDNTLRVALDTVDNPTKYVILAEVSGNAKDLVIFNNLTANNAQAVTQTEVGFEEGNITITRYDANNKAYYVGKIPDASTFRLNRSRASQVGETQNSSASVVSANFNNLNKRMGELRENPHSQGVWARVFNGEVESDFGFGSSSTYTTVQAGYDYNLSSDLDSNSYLGVAFSYLNSKTDNVVSETQGNGVEVGAYFAYVKDDGLYTDSIIKVAYMSNSNSGVSGYSLSDTDNTSFILSQEVGYQAEVVSGFYLTPQFETTYAYLGGSEMTSTYNGGSMKSTQDATNTWRNRLGLQASYKLKSEDNKFNASFYAMGSYTYDLISGGDTTFEVTNKETIANPIKSDGRFVLNVGSNIDIKDATRLYLDFEKSFGGKINTNYQINVGVRYSFGEKNSSK